jgi:lipopolysaccharide/colanic/teichoic acid biosynthesis glycosyltransferase
MAQHTSVFPVLIDSRPEYLQRCKSTSLLQMPLSEGSILTHIVERLADRVPRAPVVVRGFHADPAYDEALRATGIVRENSIHESAFGVSLRRYEPSDWLLFVDPRCFPVSGFDPEPLLYGLDDSPRLARHLIALAPTSAGTSERVELDAEDRVRCVQRYYEAVTWTVAYGVSCSLVPVSALRMSRTIPFGELTDFRRALASTALPSRDITIDGGIVDLNIEHSLLVLNERGISARSSNGKAKAPRAIIAPGARLVGDVVLHEGAQVGEQATIIGPTVIGAHSRVGHGAVVAQCVVAPGVSIADGVVARHRVVVEARPEPPAPTPPTAPEFDEGHVTIRPEGTTPRLYPGVKRFVETVFAMTSLIVLSPLLALVAALVKLDSKGPILYGDPREAKGGRLFHCYKFRTMRVGAHAAQRDLAAANQVDGPQFKMQVDPRVTRVGKWLRKTNLDELPQLFNVALGHMSLVGPRPSPFRENQTCVPWRDARLSVRPGITGLWQVCRHDRESGDFHQWIYYDIQYIRHQSLLVDVKILLATLWTGGGRTHVPLSWIVSSARNEYI